MFLNILHEHIYCPYCKKAIRKDCLRCPKCTSDLGTEFAKKEINKKSFLLSWKFYVSIIAVGVAVFSMTKMEPQYIPPVVDPNISKLQESREFFYKECMGTGSYYTPESDEYKKMEESCRKGMQSITNPEYKNISTK